VTTASGLEVSRDRGLSWERLPAQPSGAAISVATSPSDPQVLYAGTPPGSAKSGDGGQSWSLATPSDQPVLAIAASPTDPNRVLFVTQTGALYRSDDGGTTWRVPG